jgi:hypothetical protein
MSWFYAIEAIPGRIAGDRSYGMAVVLVLALACVAPAAWIVRAHARAEVGRPAVAAAVAASPPGSGVPQSAQHPILQVPVLRVVVTPRGFEPAQATVAPGPLALVVINGSPLFDSLVTIARETGEKVLDEHLPRGKPQWGGVLNLTPGNYVVTEANHSDWSLKLTVTAR